MPLQVWLPLHNNNINNIGLSNLVFSNKNTTYTKNNTAGKIGSCFENTNNTAGGLASNTTIDLGINQSMCCWINVTSFYSTSSLMGIGGQHRFSSNIGMGLTLKYISGSTGYLSVNTGTGSARTYNTYTGSTVLNSGTWYHVCYTYDGSNIRLYVNGNLDATHAYTGQSSPADYIGLFCWSLSGTSGNGLYNNYQFNGKINDFRVYDHCLSTKEIKEISKGLILHYTLDNNGMGCPNLLPGTDINIDGLSTMVTYSSGTIAVDSSVKFNDSNTIKITPGSSSTSSGGTNLYGGTVSLISGTTYCYSVWIYSTDADTFTSNSLGHFQTWVSSSSLHNRTIVHEGDTIPANKWTHVYITFTPTADCLFRSYWIYFANTSQIIYICKPKLEVGTKPTSWCPSITDSYYPSIGNSIFDTSGYNYIGAVTNSITNMADSPRYDISTYFPGTSYIRINSPTNQVRSVSFWAKLTNPKSGTYQVFFVDSASELAFGVYTQIICNCGSSRLIPFANTNFIDGQWNHIVVTRADTFDDVNLYINGVKQSHNSGGTNYWGNTSGVLDIGSRNGATSGSGPIDGYISDFRVYVTQLTDNDVKQLYNTSASIDNKGNLYSYSFVENGGGDIINLIYNGSFQYGSEGWIINNNITRDTTDSINGSNGCLDIKNAYNSIISEPFVPVNYKDSYTFEVDRKGVTTTSAVYVCIYCYDGDKNLIGTNKVGLVSANTKTTLAQDLNNGDTIVYLTTCSGWATNQTYRYVGICDSPAYDYNRAIYLQKYDSSTVNTTDKTVTLQAAWAGGKWLAGTKVANFTDGSTFIYPVYGPNWSTDWVHSTNNVTLRHGTKYIRLGVISSANMEFKLANIRFFNNTNIQYRIPYLCNTQNKNITKQGIINTTNIEESSLPIRYIRDYCGGSNQNTNCHWCEIQAFSIDNINVAYASTGKMFNSSNTEVTPSLNGRTPNNNSNSNYPRFHLITNNVIATNPYMGGVSNSGYVQLDLGSIFDIKQIKVWHYFGDGRTYTNTKTQVSCDGVNWITIFDSAIEGTYAENTNGHTINIDRNNVSLTKHGEYKSKTNYEI